MIVKKYEEYSVSDVCGTIVLQNKDLEFRIREEEESEKFIAIMSFVKIFEEDEKKAFERTE